jgi:2-aminoadipate transaminase
MAIETAATTMPASVTMNPSAPTPLPLRRRAPATTSLSTMHPTAAPISPAIASVRTPASPAEAVMMPATRPMIAASSVIPPRAEPSSPVAPAIIPMPMPIPSAWQVALKSMGRTIKTSESGTPPLRQAGGNNWPVTEREPHRRRAQTTGRDLERYAGLFAERTAVMRSSAMRDLMAITARPEVISLAGGLPDTSTFPPASFAALMTRIAEESSAEALQYGPTEGFGATVDCIIEVMRAEGMSPDPADVIVTTGGQQAIDLISKTLIDPGDPVICEAPTYPGAVPVFCSYQADVIQIACDEDGMRIDELESVLAELRAAGRRPKFIYSVPTFQNPAGVTLSLERRHRLVELAREEEILLVEDNPYGLLRYGGEPLPPLYQLDGGDFVLYVGTLSKILSPGIRLGWAVAPPPLMEKIVLGKQAADLCTSTLTQFFVREYFAEGRWREYIESLVKIYGRRRDVMLEALQQHFPPQATWTHPQGGLFIWAMLPDYLDTSDLLAKALHSDVAFVPGRAAFADGRGANSMRLNFSGVTANEIREGVRRIGQVIEEQVGLYETMTGEQGARGQFGTPTAGPTADFSEPESAGPPESDRHSRPGRRREP